MELSNRPSLGEPFDTALDEAVAYLNGLPEEIIGIWLAGSLARGEGDANSDLDLYVLVDAPHRYRVNRRCNGVPVEMFLNPPEWARRYLGENREQGSNGSISMMAEGVILYDPLDECAALAAEAKEAIELGPAVPDVPLALRRYLAVDDLDNARDVVDRDPTTARLLAAGSLYAAATYWFLHHGQWPPRRKELLPQLRVRYPQAAELIDRHAATGDLAAAEGALQLLVGEHTFYEWQTPPEPL
jgi:hypothetical protein